MFIYLALIFIIALFSLYKNSSCVIPYFLLIGISAFRAETVGIDYIGYQRAFYNEIIPFSYSYVLFKFEIGWVLFNKLIDFFSGNFKTVVFFTSLFTITPIFFIAKRINTSAIFVIFLYLILYYYFIPFSLIKQGVAISFFALGLFYWIEQKFKWGIFFIILSCLFHYSAIGLIPILFFEKYVDLSKKSKVYLLLLTFLLGFFLATINLRYLFQYLPFEKYANYSDYKLDQNVNILNTYLFILPKNVICALFIFYLRDNKKIKNFFFIGIVLANLFYSLPLFSRFVLYFFILEIFLLSLLVFQYKGEQRLKFLTIVITYSIIYTYYQFSTNFGGIVPYESYL